MLGGVSLSLELTLDDSDSRSSLLDCELRSSVRARLLCLSAACFGFFRMDLVGVLDSELMSLICSEAAAVASEAISGGGEIEGTRSSPLLELELLMGAEEPTAAGAVTFWPPPMKSSRCL